MTIKMRRYKYKPKFCFRGTNDKTELSQETTQLLKMSRLPSCCFETTELLCDTNIITEKLSSQLVYRLSVY